MCSAIKETLSVFKFQFGLNSFSPKFRCTYIHTLLLLLTKQNKWIENPENIKTNQLLIGHVSEITKTKMNNKSINIFMIIPLFLFFF